MEFNYFKMKGKITLLVAFVGMFALAWMNPVKAQDDEMDGGKDKAKISGGYGYFSPGYDMVDKGPLNTYLGGSELFPNNAVTLGGGGQLMIKSLVLGGEGNSSLQQLGKQGTREYLLEMGSGKFFLGYVLLGKKGLLLYPKVGIGGYNFRLDVNETEAIASVDSVVAGQFTGTSLIKKGTFASFALGFDWMPGFDETAGSGIVLGLEAGYNMGLGKSSWSSIGRDLQGGPNLLPDGVYLRLRLGFAGWNRQ